MISWKIYDRYLKSWSSEMKQNARITVENGNVIGKVEKNVFGSFVEHLGRSVYYGIYEPDHPSADEFGFRKDVAGLVRELGVPIIRYPGGNFVSSYRWEDGVGPVAERPARLDPNWRAIETNRVGLNEFAQWCERVGAEPMLAINLGTRGVEAALDLLDYCNHPSGTYLSDLRIKHGYPKPHNVRTWCLGNEMDGDWQVGYKTAYEYGRLAEQTARAMRMIDPDLKLVSCGSSHTFMPSFPEWEAETLSHTYDVVDYISLHQYFENDFDNPADFLAQSMETDRFIRTVIAVCDYVKAKKRGKKDIMLSFDEWNLWYHSKAHDEQLKKEEPWQTVMHLLEDVYTFEDALLAGCMLITFLKHADRLKMACLAQLVNVIAPIMTDIGGGICRQTTFYPFKHVSTYGRGQSLRAFTASPKYESKAYSDVSCVESAVVESEDGSEITLFAVNRDLKNAIAVDFTLYGFDAFRLVEHIAMESDDLKAVNTPAAPNRVTPHLRTGSVEENLDGGFTVGLNPASWNVVRFRRV